MLDPIQQEIISQALRILLLGFLPIVALVTAAGLVVSGLLAAMSVREATASYSARAVVLALAAYYFGPSVASSVASLAELVFK